MQMMLQYTISATCQSERNKLKMIEQKISLCSPEQIFRKGYSLTLSNGKVVKQAAELQPGMTITSVFSDSEVQSVVKG